MGIISGMHAAATDFDLFSQLIPAHNRELGPEAGLAFVEMVVSDRRDEVAGIGLDYLENDPRPFVQMYDYARSEGLHVTAHAGEIGPAAFVRDSIEVLGCERIDHGYHVIDDPALVEECRTAGTFFTCCVRRRRCIRPSGATRPRRNHAIRQMLDAGLTITISTGRSRADANDAGRRVHDGR